MKILSAMSAFLAIVLLLLSVMSCNKGNDSDETSQTGDGSIELVVKQENKYALIKSQTRMFIEMDLLPIKDASGKKLPLNISIVIDRSGSMLEKGKLEYVKEAVSYLVDKLGNEDTLSIVTYSDDVDVLVEQGPILSEEIIKDKLSQITGGGWTNLSGGLEGAFREVKSEYEKGEINRILLLSDGLANRGITDLPGLQRLSGDIAEKDISITTIGVGADYDEDILRTISERGVGNYYYISTPSEIPHIYEGELTSLFNTAVVDAKLSIRLTNGAKLVNIFGYDFKRVGGDIYTIDLGSLTAGVDRWVVMELQLPFKEEKEEVNLGTVWLGYQDVSTSVERDVEYSFDIAVEFTDDKDDIVEGRDISVVNTAMYLIAQQAKKDAQFYIRTGDLVSASDILTEQNLMIEREYEEDGLEIPGSIVTEMECNKDSSLFLMGGASGDISEEEISAKGKELDYDNYKKTREKKEIE